MTNILFEFNQIYHTEKDGVSKTPNNGALKTIKSLDQNGIGIGILVTKDNEGVVVTTCGVSLLETMKWFHQNGINNFNVAVANPDTVPDLVTLSILFDGAAVPLKPVSNTDNRESVSWYAIANKLIDKGYIKFTDFT